MIKMYLNLGNEKGDVAILIKQVAAVHENRNE
jgi:hypothetical protein